MLILRRNGKISVNKDVNTILTALHKEDSFIDQGFDLCYLVKDNVVIDVFSLELTKLSMEEIDPIIRTYILLFN